MQKSLSIIIPAYNEARHIKACLDAIAAQTEVPDEVIVVDNNSTDRTVEIANSYPFVTIMNESTQGIVFARNRGFNATTTDIIGRIDADSVLPIDWVTRVKAYYAEPEHFASYAYTGGGFFYNKPLPSVSAWLQSQFASSQQMYGVLCAIHPGEEDLAAGDELTAFPLQGDLLWRFSRPRDLSR